MEIPLKHLVCVTDVSGSGKSTLVHDVLYPALLRDKGKPTENPGKHRRYRWPPARSTPSSWSTRAALAAPPVPIPQSYVAPSTPSAICSPDCRRPATQIYPGHFQLQRRQRPLSGLRRQRLRARGDAIPLRRVLALSRIATAGAFARKCSRCKLMRGDGATPKSVADVLELTVFEALSFFAADSEVRLRLEPAGRRRPRVPAPRAARAHPVRRRGAAAEARRSPSPTMRLRSAAVRAEAPPAGTRAAAARCSSSMNRPPDCTSTMSRSCWAHSAG